MKISKGQTDGHYSMWNSYLLGNIPCNCDTNLQIQFHALGLDFVTLSMSLALSKLFLLELSFLNNHRILSQIKIPIKYPSSKNRQEGPRTLSAGVSPSSLYEDPICRSQHHPLSMRGNSKIMCPGAQYRRSLWQKKWKKRN